MSVISTIQKNKLCSHLMTTCYLYTSNGKKSFEEFYDEKKKYTNIPEKANIKTMYRHFIFLRNLYGFSATDYFLYELYNRSRSEIKKYISERRRCEMYDYADDKEYNHIMGNKKDFFSVYYKYMQKFIVFVDSESDYDKYLQLVSEQAFIIIKPRDGQRGLGVELVSVSSSQEVDNVFRKCLQDKLIAERVLVNDEEMAKFHPKSLNTIRVSTVMDNTGEVHILAATLRTGSGDNYVDNGHSGGIYAAIDTEQGVICTDGFNNTGTVFEFHPDSDVRFKGTQIPEWDNLLNLVKEVSRITKKLRYIGWDFVYTNPKKWVLIEGNEPGGIDIHQHPLGYGLYPLYSKYVYGNNKEG